MKWLTRFVAALVVVCLSVLIVVEVVDHTVLSPSFLEQKAKSTDSYTQLSKALSNELITKANLANNSQAVSAVNSTLTPSLLQDKLNSVLSQTIDYYKKGGSLPTLDLTTQLDQLRAAGLQIGQDNPISKPITIKSNDSIKLIANKFEDLKLASLLISLVLIVLVVFLSWERHRYKVLPDMAIVLGLLITIIGTSFSLLPSFANKYINLNSNSDSSAFINVAHNLADSIAKGIGAVFLVIGLVSLVGGIVFRLILARQKPKVKLKASRK